MLTEKQKQICEQYRKKDREGKVHCRECPLAVDHNDYICRANADCNPHTREWGEYYSAGMNIKKYRVINGMYVEDL